MIPGDLIWGNRERERVEVNWSHIWFSGRHSLWGSSECLLELGLGKCRSVGREVKREWSVESTGDAENWVVGGSEKAAVCVLQ